MCKCLLNVDGNKWLLWHDRKGKMIDYSFLNLYLHEKVKGQGILATWTARADTMISSNYKTSLSYQTFQKACLGYESRLEFPPDTFICDHCGKNPDYLPFV